MDETSKQEPTSVSVEEQISHLETILNNPTNQYSELAEVNKLAPALAKTHPDLARKVITDYFEPHIPDRQFPKGSKDFSHGLYVEGFIIPILSALGDTEGIKRRITRDYLGPAISTSMGEVTIDQGKFTLEDLGRIIDKAIKGNPEISVDIGNALIKEARWLKSGDAAADASYAATGQYQKNADAWYGRLQDRKFQFRNVAIPLLAMAGQISIDTDNKELGQTALDELAKYKDEITEANKFFDDFKRNNPTSYALIDRPNDNMLIGGGYNPFGITYHTVEMYHHAIKELSSFQSTEKPS